ncbi:hypothetical protein VPH35_062395 [Triticum aestivum]
MSGGIRRAVSPLRSFPLLIPLSLPLRPHWILPLLGATDWHLWTGASDCLLACLSQIQQYSIQEVCHPPTANTWGSSWRRPGHSRLTSVVPAGIFVALATAPAPVLGPSPEFVGPPRCSSSKVSTYKICSGR